MNFIYSPKNHSAFTLIELLVVMGIIGVLMAVTILVINPNQNFQKARDTTRISDLNNLYTALNMYVIDTGNDFSSPDYTVYVSLPDSSPTCAAWSLPALPTSHPWVYHCSPSDTYRKIDGTGWIPVNFTLSPSRPLSTLPIDPTNNATYYYSFVKGGSFELNAITESPMGAAAASSDGGVDPAMLEMGTNLNLSPFTHGLVGYWNFDETSGTTAIDSSGYGNTGTLMNGPTHVTGKVSNALSFDGVDDYVDTPLFPSIPSTSNYSLSTWIYLNQYPSGLASIIHLLGMGWRFQIWITNTGRWGWLSQSNSITTYYNGNTLPLHEWIFLTVSINASQVILYVNAEPINTLTRTIDDFGNFTGISIARETPTSTFVVSGLIDDVRIYNRALSASEVLALYNATK